MNWYLEALKKYAVFGGRARRKEYWYFMLFNILINIALIIIDVVAGTFSPEVGMGLFGGIYVLAMLIPGIAVLVRRLHDTGHSGWWLLIILVPLIGAIVLIVFTVQDSQQGENKYGANPKATAADSSRVAATRYHSPTLQQNTRPAPAVAREERVNIAQPVGQQPTAADEEGIYATIANELETGVADKGLWTRLFAECGGDEKQTKVRYIKQRAERLISAERSRLEQAAQDCATEAAWLEKLRLQGLQEKVDAGGLYNLAYNAYEIKDYAKAEIIYNLLLEKFPNSKEVKWAKFFFKFEPRKW